MSGSKPPATRWRGSTPLIPPGRIALSPSARCSTWIPRRCGALCTLSSGTCATECACTGGLDHGVERQMTPPLLRLALALFEESQQLAAASGGNRPGGETAIGGEQGGEVRAAGVADVVGKGRQ